MDEFHTIRVPLNVGRNSVAYWALQRPRRAIIFAHGFRGSAAATFGRVADIARQSPALSDADLLFFDYTCARKQVPRLAADFVRLLDDIDDGVPLVEWDRLLHDLRGGRTEYEDIVIVAHSLGAVIARRALLDAHKAGKPWVDRTGFIFYAPAHLGARVHTLIDLTLGKIPLPVDALVKTYYPCLEELEPGSTTLRLIYEESVSAYAAHCEPVRARAIAMADDEQVVDANAFFKDPPGVPVANTDHMSVVKCKSSQQDAYRLLEKWLT